MLYSGHSTISPLAARVVPRSGRRARMCRKGSEEETGDVRVERIA